MVSYRLGRFIADTEDATLMLDVHITGVDGHDDKRDNKYTKKIKKFMRKLENDTPKK